MTQKEISHRHYIRRKEQGLCPKCGKPLDREGHYCTKCLEERRIYNNETRQFRRDFHICTECGKEKVFGSEKTCPECRAKRMGYRANITDEQRLERNRKSRDRRRTIYKQRSEVGICTRCGKRKAEHDRKMCRICLNRDAEYHRKEYISRHERPAYNLCYKCGEPITTKGMKLCDKCCETNSKSLEGKRAVNVYWKEQNALVFGKG